MDFLPIELMLKRSESSKDNSDISFFYDLISLGEMVTKISALFLVSNLDDDVDRTRYRFEYNLVRADGVGTFAEVISSIVRGSAADLLSIDVRDVELPELTARMKSCSWQKEALIKLNQCLNDLNINANEITDKSSLLIWFSNFSVLRNKSKGHGSITQSQCSIVNENLFASINLVYNNLSLFHRSWAYLHQNYSKKYRVNYINSKTSKYDYLKSSTSFTLRNGIYCYTDKPRKVNLFYSDSELSYFSIVNGNFSGSNQFESLDYLTNEKRYMDGTEYLIPPSKLPDSITRGGVSLDVHGDAFTNLPKCLADYVNRTELESELQSVLLDEERFPIITLKGRGGIGKTSLAIRVIDNIIEMYPSRFQVVVWFSARDVDLSIDGPRQVQAVVANQKDISKEYFNQIGQNGHPSKNVIEDFSRELTLNSLGKALYIFDNFETLSNPVEVFEWLNSYVRLPNKILITSRLNRNFKADYPVEVKGMTEPECRTLTGQIAGRFNISTLLNESYISKLINESDGHPYIIKIILGDVAKAQKLTEIKRIVADKDKILDALFKRTYSMLSLAAKRVFLTLCSWHSVIPQIALESVVLREDNERIDIYEAIEELSMSSFIEIIDRVDDIFLFVPLAAAMYGSKELEVSPERRLILQDKKLLMEFGAGTERGLVTLKSHIIKKIKAINLRINTPDQLDKEIPSLECLSAKYPLIWHDIAMLYHRFGQTDKEKEAYRELLKVADSDSKLKYWKELAQLCADDGDWIGESASLAEIIENPNTQYSDISNIATRINKHYSESSDGDRLLKNQLCENVIAVMEGRIAEADANDCSRLAWLCLNLQDEVKALKYAELGIKISPDNQHCISLIDRLKSKGASGGI